MATNLDRYRKDIEHLIKRGEMLLYSLYAEYMPGQFAKAFNDAKITPAKLLEKYGRFVDGYQSWYSEAKALVKQLLPDRLADFVRHYEKPKPRKDITFESYRIEDCLQGLKVTKGYSKEIVVDNTAAIPHFQQQLKIVQAVTGRFESSLFDIRQLVQADLFDSNSRQGASSPRRDTCAQLVRSQVLFLRSTWRRLRAITVFLARKHTRPLAI